MRPLDDAFGVQIMNISSSGASMVVRGGKDVTDFQYTLYTGGDSGKPRQLSLVKVKEVTILMLENLPSGESTTFTLVP